MAQIVINNKNYTGTSIVVSNGKIKIDGKDVVLEDEKVINISVTGSIDSLSVDDCNKLEITGDVGSVTTVSGDVNCAHVKSYVNTTSGDVRCGDVGASVKTVSGDVIANSIQGSVNTVSGNIHK